MRREGGVSKVMRKTPTRRIVCKGILLVIIIVMLASTIAVATSTKDNNEGQGNLGYKYCGKIEKKYGLMPGNTSYNRIIGPRTYYIQVTGIIDRAVEDYITSAIMKAENDNALLVIELNTPGGYLDSALNIVTNISKARVPIVGFVVNKWAESAGTLILVSTHVAAMQPGTIIGSMQPVAYNPSTGSYEPINESKILNPIIQVLCQHAATRGRNATALVRFVLYNDNYGADQALRYHVIDLKAENLPDLIRKLNGSIIALPSGDTVRLNLNGDYYEIPPGPRIRLVHSLSDPILSGLLVSLGMLIILFGLASGHYASAGLGALLLVLGMVGTGFNPNTASLILIILGSILVIVELHTPGFGIIGGTGIAMLVFGIALLPVGSTGFAISPAYASTILRAIYGVGAVFAGITAYAVYKIIQVRRRKPVVWSIIGIEGKAIDEITPEKPGFVIVEGEYWKAIAEEGEIKPGETIRVVRKEGPLLIVVKTEDKTR